MIFPDKKQTRIMKDPLNRAVQGILSLSKNFSKSPNICIMEETGV